MTLVHWFVRLRWSILLLVLALMTLGLLGVARSETLAGGSGRMWQHQMVFVPLSIVVMLAVSWPSYRILFRASYVLYAAVLAMLVAVFFFPTIGGTHRWIRLGPIGFQPSELAKVIVVLALARWLMYRDNYRQLRGLVVPLGLTLVPVVLILREPDLGTSLVFLPVLFVLLFAAGARYRDLAVVAVAGLLFMPVLWTQMSREQKSRVTAVITQTPAEERPDDDRYHLYRAKQTLAMGSWGGTWWRGTESEIDSANYLVPAGATDSIITILAERYGLVGLAGILVLYGLLFWRCLTVARATQEPFGRLLAAGVATLFAVQVLINVGMMVGLLPITGLSLPLISYGGSGLVAHGVALGLVLNVGLRPGYEVAGEPFRFS